LVIGLNLPVDSGNGTQFCLSATDYEIITILISRKQILTKLVSLKLYENSANADPQKQNFGQLTCLFALT